MTESSMTSAQTCKEIAYADSPNVKQTHNVGLPLTIVELFDLEDHDREKWVEGELYQKFREVHLSNEEFNRIEKYRTKYNTRLESQETRYDLAKTILDATKQYESEYVDFNTDNTLFYEAIIKKVAKQVY